MTMDDEARTLVRQLADALRPLGHEVGTAEDHEAFATSSHLSWAAKRRVNGLIAEARAAIASTETPTE